ncbi:N-acetyldiaminopimelate deacetylase [Oceanobacillus iheyensis]|uniref:N-acetyldiaminopimelate deacetylase n=1 Tax=Oceanobacillus iheyensis (strain DSM 14371 / CIP 107618 / JCM 11309 / KCTC 3954 / HTE831) TaxID=221109 RepID=DAPEL_OCEIH|nr:N-acetyldiaminopimelate deacetylase [Oceanobacillus iheyensis]Q8ERA3.1 RecName: Full=N-acetyldiaminopimelate deacetylase [Oceanobacillus iheyensis HTE831]BAC13359.1 hippurate hydrolase [Oceanobacillus iheyensis HTE831]
MMLQLEQIRRDLHQIPELGFQEFKTQAYLLERINEIATENVEIKKWSTGILVYVHGKSPARKIGFRADIDGLPILEQTNLPYASLHEGRMHACGHDLHMTIALGALEKLIQDPINDDVIFVFQPAEEGPGGAKPMLESEEFQQWKPDMMFALHIAPELPVGTVSSKAGLLFANTSELFIDFEGVGGHAAYPHLTKDMTVAASNFVVQLQQIVSRGLNPLDGSVITIGKMESGYVQNAIAETARLEGTIRSTDADAIDMIKSKLNRLMKGFEISYDCTIKVDYGANYYQVVNDATYVQQFENVINQTQTITYQQADAAMTGEDFGDMLKEIPGFMFWLGVDSSYGLHNARLNPKEEAIDVGVNAVISMITSF